MYKRVCLLTPRRGRLQGVAEIEFRGVGKTYADGTEAVSGVDLSVAEGEFMVLVGPSGCGKSTLLRMLAGLEPVTEGEILIDGKWSMRYARATATLRWCFRTTPFTHT